MGKLAAGAVVALLIWMVVRDPTGSAEMVKSLGGMLGSVGNSAVTFITALGTAGIGVILLLVVAYMFVKR